MKGKCTIQYDAFISYRRKGGSESAALVKRELEKRGIKSSRIFMDTSSLSSGNYQETISSAISSSRNIVIVITENCFNELEDNSNWAKEIAEALTAGTNIIPMYFDGINQVNPQSLPDSIKLLSFENAVLYVHEYADASFDKLADRLVKSSGNLPAWVKWAAVAVASSGLALGAYSALDANADLKDNEVYIVESSSSKCYHIDNDCISLQNATHKLKKVSLKEAESMGKRPCKICCEGANWNGK